MSGTPSPDDLVARVAALAKRRPRIVLGIAGAPAAGKSSLTEHLVRGLNERRLPAVGVPMDGFHLADAALDTLGRRDRKGAVDTFDVHGYLALLRRLRAEQETTVYAPAFERDLEQPVAGSIAVPPETRVVVSEGNYLLLEEPPWPEVWGAFDEVWYVDLDDDVRRARLLDRHVRFGKAPEAARAWVAAVDEPNAALIAASAGRADLRVDVSGWDLRA
ncbi:nucleoside/nucleotide kinase family protein [Trujillonella endophytica]|uniref:Phosphoribulokinase / Uridine kinase family protein n=1 Tax=Trujillonella endophytica TaxID=673521 RepID=A0A1H8WML7_9ACTN|nr:nucleoside/nucleotide kinase family protein [Trujillella endophytica]SEP28872.1 Phosphoribulokinase / Uridine kinase family protein [Trujillella endophytica]